MKTPLPPLHRSNFEMPAIWTQIAADYADVLLPIFERYARHALGLIESREDMRALDLACGPGTLSLPLLEKVRQVDAVDFSQRMLDQLGERAAKHLCSPSPEQLRPQGASAPLPGLFCHKMDGHQLDFGDAIFDAALSMFGVVHFADPARGLREMHRVLKPGGVVLASTWASPNESTINALAASAMRQGFQNLPTDTEIFHGGRSPAQWCEELAHAGFVETRVESLVFEFEVPSPEVYWTNMSRASVPLVLLQNSCTTAQWERGTQKALEHLRRQKPWPHPVCAKGYFFIGRKED